MTKRFALLWALSAICLLNCYLTITNLYKTRRSSGNSDHLHYSYIGADYPLELPIDPLPDVEMTLHESIHFPLSGPEADYDWETVATNPRGYGWVRIGDDHRLFAMVIFHELHCLRQLQRGLGNRNHTYATPHHIQHCLNYLRQSILCRSADSLETGDFMERNYTTDRVGDTIRCQDWGQLYDWAGNNSMQWDELESQLQIS